MRLTIVGGFFLPVPPILGGSTEKIWHRLAREFAAAGHEVMMVSRRWPGWPNIETEADGRLTHLRLPGCRHTRYLPVNLILDFLWGLQVAWHLPPADVVVCNTVSLPIYLRRIKPSAGRVAVVLGRMPKGQNRAYAAVDSLLATSHAVVDKILAENPTLATRIFRFPNPIDWQLHHDAALAASKGPLTIGYIGRIHPEKGLEQLLDAAVILQARTDLPAWRVELTGPVAVPQGGGGEAYRNRLLARYRPQLGDRLVLNAPEYDANKLARIYGRTAVFCYPSLAEQGETFGIAVAEAMAAGAVPVLSDLACFRDLVDADKSGLFFDHRTPRAPNLLAATLARLLCEPDLRRELGSAAQAAVRRYDFPVCADQLLANFARLTGQGVFTSSTP